MNKDFQEIIKILKKAKRDDLVMLFMSLITDSSDEEEYNSEYNSE
tara:strand:+ start:2252 stop:2386 length:135 start_codon:yes stop_codon:yes gene_type:complete